MPGSAVRREFGGGRAWFESALRRTSWTSYYVELKLTPPNHWGHAPMQEDPYDTGGTSSNVDLSQITKVQFYWQEARTDSPTYSTTVLVDNVQYGRTPVPTAASDWSLFE